MASPRAPDRDRLLALVDSLAGQPVVLWVDLVVDRFVHGTAKRISREAPVLILRYEGETITPGGGANAVANVAALGGRPLPLGVVGDDPSGDALLAAFEALSIPTTGILRRAGYRTPTKTRILGGARHGARQQIVRYDVEDQLELSVDDQEQLLQAAAGFDPPRAAVVSDYGYGTVVPGLLPRLRAALPAGCPLLGDSRYRLAELVGLDGATPNAEEAEALLEDGTGGLESAGVALRRRLDTGFLLITRGSEGMSLFSAEGAAHLPVHGSDQPVDVTGAGDTVIGTFALALAAGGSPLEATYLANYAGGVVVMKPGTATLGRDELRRAIFADSRPLEELRWVAS